MPKTFTRPDEMPGTIPVFPLPQALLLPRGRMPLNIFEPRYLAMVDHALGADRVIGMIQPAGDADGDAPALSAVGCAGRITQFAETGDGRYLLTLTGVCRFAVEAEVDGATPFRQCRVAYGAYASDLEAGHGETAVDRAAVIGAMRAFADATSVSFDWDSVEKAGNETLVNALSMLAPFGVREKQALLEAESLQRRAETLVALTEIELARSAASGSATLQ